MSRFFESIFVIGCAAVGLAMSASDGRLFQNTLKSSVQLISFTEDHLRCDGKQIGVFKAPLPRRVR